MPSTALVLVVALATASAQEEGGHYTNKKGLRKLHRRAQVMHIEKAEYRQGLEEDVVFWTKMIRNTQEMSYPVAPAPVPTTDTLIPTIMIDPTDPPLAGGSFSPSSLNIDPTDPPVGGGSFIPTSSIIDPTDPPVGVGTPIPTSIVIDPTDPPVSVGPPIAETLTPTIDLVATTPPNTGVIVDPPTEPPAGGGGDNTGGTGGDFKCPDVSTIMICLYHSIASHQMFLHILNSLMSYVHPLKHVTRIIQANFVGCTAVDPSDPVEECPIVGEPCPDSTGGEFCCLDACPRNYCTAKQSPSSVVGEVKFFVPLQFDEIP